MGGSEVTLGGLAMAFAAMMIQITLFMVNRQNNKTKAEANTLNFQAAYLDLSKEEVERGKSNMERITRLERLLDQQIDLHKAKDDMIAAAKVQTEKYARTIEVLEKSAMAREAKIEALEANERANNALIATMRADLDSVRAEVAVIRKELAAVKEQAAKDLADRDLIIKEKDAEIATLKDENGRLKAQIAAVTTQDVTSPRAGEVASNG